MCEGWINSILAGRSPILYSFFLSWNNESLILRLNLKSLGNWFILSPISSMSNSKFSYKFTIGLLSFSVKTKKLIELSLLFLILKFNEQF